MAELAILVSIGGLKAICTTTPRNTWWVRYHKATRLDRPDCSSRHMRLNTTVWYEIIFRHLNGYNSANMPDIDQIPFDNCLDINS